MPSLISKLKSFKSLHSLRPGHQKEEDHKVPALPSPRSPQTPRHLRTSLSPKLRTFFGPYSPKAKLGVLESPKSPESPESAYSGIALFGDVEVVRRVSKGKLKRIELTKVHTYESASAGTQTEDQGRASIVREALKRRSGLAWEMLHSGDAGLLFMTNPTKSEEPTTEGNGSVENTALPLTGNLLLKLQQAIAGDADLQACQKRTTREIATLNSYQENLRKRKETLKDRLEELKTAPNYDLNDEKSDVDKQLVRVWEASIETMDERLRCEERLEKKRDEFEALQGRRWRCWRWG